MSFIATAVALAVATPAFAQSNVNDPLLVPPLGPIGFGEGTNFLVGAAVLTANDIPLAQTAQACASPDATGCLEGSPTQDTGATCPASNLCNYPREVIQSCAVLNSVPATCAVVGGNPTFTWTDPNYSGLLDFTYTTDNGVGTALGVTIVPVADDSFVSAVTGQDLCSNTLQDTDADYCIDEDDGALTIEVEFELADQSTPDAAESITQVVITGVPNGTSTTTPSPNGLLTAPGKTISCAAGTCTVTGTFTITNFTTSLVLMYTPPTHFATTSIGESSMEWEFTATTQDGADTQVGTTSDPVLIEVQGVADGVTLDYPDHFVGPEGQPILLTGAGGIEYEFVDTDDSENITAIRFLNMPTNAVLVNGGGTIVGVRTPVGGTTVRLTQAEFDAGVRFRWNDAMPAIWQQNNNNVPNLQVEFDTSEDSAPISNAVDASTSMQVQVNAVAAQPALTIANASPTATEWRGTLPMGHTNTRINLGLSGALAGGMAPDPSEQLRFRILVPAGSTLHNASSGGTAFTPFATNSYEIPAASIANVFWQPPLDEHGMYNIRVQAVAVDFQSGGTIGGTCTDDTPALECTQSNQCDDGQCVPSEAYHNNDPDLADGSGINVTVQARANDPTISLTLPNPRTVNEGTQNVPFPLSAASTDTSSAVASQAESCEVEISWTVDFDEAGDVMNTANSVVIDDPDGSGNASGWTIDCSDFTSLQIDLPQYGSGNAAVVFTTEVTVNDQGNTFTKTGPTYTLHITNTVPLCGDTIVDPNTAEQCDSGSGNGNVPDTCRDDCQLPACGDGIVDDYEGEECDDGIAGESYFPLGGPLGVGNNNTVRDACRTTCVEAHCGDSVLDSFEGCDDGNNGVQTDSCLLGCVAASCGDGFVWNGMEECDAGLMNSDSAVDGCRTTCVDAFCGDGVTDTGETCDDGGGDDDGCPGTCELAVCGDGFVFAGMEQCDEGADNDDSEPDACRTDCLNARCGDGAVDTGEECDDSDTVNEDLCTNACLLNICGDGFVEAETDTEECDDGQNNSNSVPDACRPSCDNPSCGDGVQDSGESCDLGPANNDNDPNGCKTNCALPGCGDGVVGPGEQCDDGPLNSNSEPDACRETCTNPRCGDGVVDMSEVCDDGPANNDTVANACRRNCQPARCGDGVVDQGETCDSGVNNSDTVPGACRTSCQVASCGDGIQDPGEMCDDGPNNSDSASGACRTTCVLADCGDGVVDPGESCDDGPANGTDPNGCEADCSLPPACGDGVVDAGEECDDGALNSDTEPDACRTDCTNPLCGDGVTDSGEECDAGMTPSDTCDSDCVLIAGEDMGMGDDMGGNNVNNVDPDAGNNASNSGTGPDAGGEDMAGEPDSGGGGGGVTPAAEDGCCRTIRRSDGDSGVAGLLAILALGLISVRRRR